MTSGINFTQWLKKLAGEDTQKIISKKSGIIESTLSRQLSRGHLRPEMVIALCRGYGKSPVTGLIETGYLNKWETEGVPIPYALEQATNQQILDEILRRSDPQARELFGGAGHENEVIGLTHVTEPTSTPTAHPAENWRNMPRPKRFAADSSPHEPSLGDDNYHEGP